VEQGISCAIGGRLREARKASKLSQEEVATELSVKRQTVSAWERGKAVPRGQDWYRIGMLYGASLDYLVYGIRLQMAGSRVLEDVFRERESAQADWPAGL
jgi:transcriptional regulator with XRE-family HTH domain